MNSTIPYGLHGPLVSSHVCSGCNFWLVGVGIGSVFPLLFCNGQDTFWYAVVGQEDLWLLVEIEGQSRFVPARHMSESLVEVVNLAQVQQFAFHLTSTRHEQEGHQIRHVLHGDTHFGGHSPAIEEDVISNELWI